MEAIDTVNQLSQLEFHRSYICDKPVVIKGGVKNSKMFNRWTLPYLQSKIGSRMVQVSYNKVGVFNYNAERTKVPFDELIALATSERSDNKSYYLQQASIVEHLPELLEDVERPGLILDTDMVNDPYLWLGAAGCVSRLHFDNEDNFLIQIKGRKEVYLFSPADTIYLYQSEKAGGTHMSEIDLDNIDHERFPLARHARKYHCIVEAGDMLFIPHNWWHHVRSLDTSISINYWFTRFDVVDSSGLESAGVQDLCGLIKQFVDRGASIDHKDVDGEALLLKAIRKGYANVVEAFLTLGADPNVKSYRSNPDGTSALLLAIANRNPEIVRLLLRFGADDLQTSNKAAAFDLAKKLGGAQVAQLLEESLLKTS